MSSLEVVKNAKITGSSHEDNVNRDLQKLIAEQTDNYTKPDKISSQKIDMTPYLEKRNISVSDYKAKFGSVMRSEQDVVDALAKRVGSSAASSDADAEKAKRKRKMEMRERERARKAKAIKIKMGLKN